MLSRTYKTTPQQCFLCIFRQILECAVVLRVQSYRFNYIPKGYRSLADGYFYCRVQTESAVSAANRLLQCAEASFPKHKKMLAVTEFKQAKVAHKRRCKTRQEEEGTVFKEHVLFNGFQVLLTLKISNKWSMLENNLIAAYIIYQPSLDLFSEIQDGNKLITIQTCSKGISS